VKVGKFQSDTFPIGLITESVEELVGRTDRGKKKKIKATCEKHERLPKRKTEYKNRAKKEKKGFQKGKAHFLNGDLGEKRKKSRPAETEF